MPEVGIVEVPAARVSLADAVSSYLFNAQLVSLPTGEQALVLPEEARANAAVWRWLEDLVADNGQIRRLDRTRVVSGKGVFVRVDIGGRRSINKTIIQQRISIIYNPLNINYIHFHF